MKCDDIQKGNTVKGNLKKIYEENNENFLSPLSPLSLFLSFLFPRVQR